MPASETESFSIDMTLAKKRIGIISATVALLQLIAFSALAGPKVLMLTPRGNTSMEDIYKEKVLKAVPDAIFMLVKTDPASSTLAADIRKIVAAEKPSLIYSWGTPTTLAATGTFDKPNISNIPIVFSVVTYPLQARIVQNLEKPGRNVTGVMHLAPLISQVEAIKKYKPFRLLGVVVNPLEPNSRLNVDQLRAVAADQNFTVLAESVAIKDGVPDPASIASAVQKLKYRGVDWLYLGPDTFVSFTHRSITASEAIRQGLPTFTANQSAIKEGDALYGLYAPVESLADLAAKKSIAILTGKSRVESIPIEALQRFAFAVNFCTAKKLHMLPPMSLSFAEFTCTPKD